MNVDKLYYIVGYPKKEKKEKNVSDNIVKVWFNLIKIKELCGFIIARISFNMCL